MPSQKLLYIPLAAIIAWLIIGLEGSHYMIDMSERTVAGTVNSPFQYRVLSAYLLVELNRVLGTFPALWLFWFLNLALFSILMDAWLSLHLLANRVMGGVLLSLLLSLAFISFMPSGAMWSGPEAVFWVATLLVLHNHGVRLRYLVPLVVAATLTRETACFLVALTWIITRRLRPAVVLGVVWAVTYGMLRWYYGSAPPDMTLSRIWYVNTSTFRFTYFLLGLVLFGWVPLMAAYSYSHAPRFLRRAAIGTAPYLAAIAAFGIWREFRLFLPLLPVAVPLVMGVRQGPIEN